MRELKRPSILRPIQKCSRVMLSQFKWKSKREKILISRWFLRTRMKKSNPRMMHLRLKRSKNLPPMLCLKTKEKELNSRLKLSSRETEIEVVE